MTGLSSNSVIWGVIPAAGLSRRMGFPKQSTIVGASTMAATVARNMLRVGAQGVVVVTRSDLLSALALPRDKRIVTAVNDQAGTEMIDSIKMGLSVLAANRPHATLDEQDVTIGRRVQSHIRHYATDVGFDQRAAPADGIMVVPADMPAISLAAYAACVSAYLSNPGHIVIATCHGRNGHPIVFPFSMRDELGGLAGGLRMLPQAFPDRLKLVETGDPGTLHDVDTPDDLEIL